MPTGNHFLDSLPFTIQQLLLPFLSAARVSKEDFLWQQGETSNWVYFPISAVISQYQVMEDGRALEVAIIGREAAAGLASAFGSQESINCSQVRVSGQTLRIRTGHILDVSRREPLLNAGVVDLLGRQITQMARKLICNHYHKTDGRICTWLLMIADRSGSSKVPATHEQLAVALGVVRPHLTDVAKSLRNAGLIGYSRGYIELLDPLRMAELACDCYKSIAETHGA